MNLTEVAKQHFRILVRDTLPVGRYENLSETLNCTKNRVTKILENPEVMDWVELSSMSSELDLNPSTLIDDFDCGIDTITIRQYRELLKHDRSL